MIIRGAAALQTVTEECGSGIVMPSFFPWTGDSEVPLAARRGLENCFLNGALAAVVLERVGVWSFEDEAVFSVRQEEGLYLTLCVKSEFVNFIGE